MVGLIFLLQQTPFTVTAEAPIEVTLPPEVAPDEVIELADVVVTAAGVNVLKDKDDAL